MAYRQGDFSCLVLVDGELKLAQPAGVIGHVDRLLLTRADLEDAGVHRHRSGRLTTAVSTGPAPKSPL